MLTPKDIEWMFIYHPPKPGQVERYEALRASARVFAKQVLEFTPTSAEQTLAIRKIQEAVMYANAAIAITESKTGRE